jgi:Spy/CpxP family protein refolding chaperone
MKRGGFMKTGRITAWVCLASMMLISWGFAQEEPKRELSGHSGMREKGFLREGILRDRKPGEEGLGDIIIEKIVNNPKLTSELKLTEEQIKTLKTAAEDGKKKQTALQEQMKAAGMEQAKLMTQESIDENAIFSAVEKTGQIRIEMAKEKIRQMLVVKKTLTPEQSAKIKEMVQNRVKQMRKESGDFDKEHQKKFREEKNKENKPAPSI